MLKSLPTSNETPGLLDDITYVGTSAGLTFKLLNWQPEIPKEFYTELPIQIEVTGSYHEFGDFVSNIANLPRIVTLHDFEVAEAMGIHCALVAAGHNNRDRLEACGVPVFDDLTHLRDWLT